MGDGAKSEQFSNIFAVNSLISVNEIDSAMKFAKEIELTEPQD